MNDYSRRLMNQIVDARQHIDEVRNCCFNTKQKVADMHITELGRIVEDIEELASNNALTSECIGYTVYDDDATTYTDYLVNVECDIDNGWVIRVADLTTEDVVYLPLVVNLAMFGKNTAMYPWLYEHWNRICEELVLSKRNEVNELYELENEEWRMWRQERRAIRRAVRKGQCTEQVSWSVD